MSEDNVQTTGPRADVTIVIPCYRHAHYLDECLQSLLAQTYPHWQAIVVDDASPDHGEMRKVVDGIGDPRIRIVRHEQNKGPGASRNTGIREGATDLLLPLDADDRLDPAYLESLVPLLRGDEKLDCVFPDLQRFGRRSDVTRFHGPPPGRNLLRVEDTLPGAGTLMRRHLWERVGGYDEADVMRRGREGFEFWIRAFTDTCRFAHVDKPLYLFRASHTSMGTAGELHDADVFSYIYDKHRQIFDSAGEGQSFLSTGHDNAAGAAYEAGDRARAVRMAIKAWRIVPTGARARSVAGLMLSPAVQRALRGGAVRRRIPLLGWPLRGRERYRPFFIIGVGRSGNTLLRRILTSHSQLHIPPETFVLGPCIQKFRYHSKRMSWPDLVQAIMAEFAFHPEFHTFEMDLAPLVNRLADAESKNRNLAYLFDAFYRFHAETHGIPLRRWGDKTPMNSLDDAIISEWCNTPRPEGRGVPQTLERLIHVFPDAQFVHIYRDGCDVAHSHLSGGFMVDIEEAARRWLHVVRQSSNFVRRYPKQGFELRYEDLIARPEETARALCQFLEVEFESRMVSSERSASGLGDVPQWYWHQQVHKPINPENAGKGRTNLTAAEKDQVQRIIGEELSARGYPPATAGP